MVERQPIDEARKKEWLADLSNFIVEANKNTWAADKGAVSAFLPGFKTHEYISPNGLWRMLDMYDGYFRAPGFSVVYYKGKPAWTMQYGGHGQTEGYEDRAKQTFQFLRSALMRVSPELPFRGPEVYCEGDNFYTFIMRRGDITDGEWTEEINEGGYVTFAQIGLVGIFIHRDENKNPLPPWDS